VVLQVGPGSPRGGAQASDEASWAQWLNESVTRKADGTFEGLIRGGLYLDNLFVRALTGDCAADCVPPANEAAAASTVATRPKKENTATSVSVAGARSLPPPPAGAVVDKGGGLLSGGGSSGGGGGGGGSGGPKGHRGRAKPKQRGSDVSGAGALAGSGGKFSGKRSLLAQATVAQPAEAQPAEVRGRKAARQEAAAKDNGGGDVDGDGSGGDGAGARKVSSGDDNGDPGGAVTHLSGCRLCRKKVCGEGVGGFRSTLGPSELAKARRALDHFDLVVCGLHPVLHMQHQHQHQHAGGRKT
jgi:hypothetical protein